MSLQIPPILNISRFFARYYNLKSPSTVFTATNKWWKNEPCRCMRKTSYYHVNIYKTHNFYYVWTPFPVTLQACWTVHTLPIAPPCPRVDVYFTGVEKFCQGPKLKISYTQKSEADLIINSAYSLFTAYQILKNIFNSFNHTLIITIPLFNFTENSFKCLFNRIIIRINI